MEKLGKIIYDEENAPSDFIQYSVDGDCITTYLKFNGDNWTDCTFKAIFPTLSQGILCMKIQYCGTKFCRMTVIQKMNGEKYIHEMRFKSFIFVQFVKECITKAKTQWPDKSFTIDEEVLRLYNEILDVGEGYDKKRVDKE